MKNSWERGSIKIRFGLNKDRRPSAILHALAHIIDTRGSFQYNSLTQNLGA